MKEPEKFKHGQEKIAQPISSERRIDEWLGMLEQEQSRAGTEGFPEGSIPSYRLYPVLNIRRPDPNVFFPALIADLLARWMPQLSDSQATMAEFILQKIRSTFPLYRSRRGRMHYNFWPVSPDVPFPNGRWLSRFDFFRLPDDIDDTALVYRALQADKETVEQLQKDIELHLATHYPHRPCIYPAWLGDKMPWITDACAMVNLLLLFGRHSLSPTSYTMATETYLTDLIMSGLHLKSPYRVAPYYPDSAVIAWHLSRWVSGELGQIFKRQTEPLAQRERHPFRKMLYYQSLMLAGHAATDGTMDVADTKLVNNFPWFFGTMLSAVNQPWLRKAGRIKFMHIAHVCPAWNRSLLLENERRQAELHAVKTRPTVERAPH